MGEATYATLRRAAGGRGGGHLSPDKEGEGDWEQEKKMKKTLVQTQTHTDKNNEMK